MLIFQLPCIWNVEIVGRDFEKVNAESFVNFFKKYLKDVELLRLQQFLEWEGCHEQARIK